MSTETVIINGVEYAPVATDSPVSKARHIGRNSLIWTSCCAPPATHSRLRKSSAMTPKSPS